MARVIAVFGRGTQVHALIVYNIAAERFSVQYLAGDIDRTIDEYILEQGQRKTFELIALRAPLNIRWVRDITTSELHDRITKWKDTHTKAGFTYYGNTTLTS